MNKLSIAMSRRETIFGWCYYAFQVLALQFLIEYLCYILKFPLTQLRLNVIFFSVNFFSLTIIFFSFLRKSITEAVKKWKTTLKTGFLGFVFYWALNVFIYNLIIILSPGYFNMNDSTIGSMAQGNFALLAFCTVILAPVTEELVFRGLIFGGLYNKSRVLAYLVSTLVFSAIHVVSYIPYMTPLHMVLSILQYVPAGVALGWAYAKADNICVPILIHMFINFLGTIALR